MRVNSQQQNSEKGYAVSKELTHFTSFCNVQFSKNQNMMEIFDKKSLLNISNLTLMTQKALADVAVPQSSH